MAIDDNSLKAVGRWPWSREDMARLLTRLKQAGPRVIALDIIFAEKEQTLAYQALKELSDALARRGVSPEILKILEMEKKRADVDRLLTEVIGQGLPHHPGVFFPQPGRQDRRA